VAAWQWRKGSPQNITVKHLAVYFGRNNGFIVSVLVINAEDVRLCFLLFVLLLTNVFILNKERKLLICFHLIFTNHLL